MASARDSSAMALTPSTKARPGYGGPLAMLLADHPDAELAELLIEWRKAAERGLAIGNVTADIEHDCMAFADRIRDRITSMPVQTVEGFAIKAYLALHYEIGGTRDNHCMIEFADGSMVDRQGSPVRLVVADAFRHCPLLEAVVDPDGYEARRTPVLDIAA
jgi:hypothetical protein